MDTRKIFGLILLLSSLSTCVILAINVLNILNSSMEENIQKGIDLIVESITPWWVDVIIQLSKLPGPIAGILITAFIIALVSLKKLEVY